MKKFILLLLVYPLSALSASDVTTCQDASSVGAEARLTLHDHAQSRAQREIERFVEKEIARPYVDVFGQETDADGMATLIEVFWCNYPEMPLHSAYYSFYSRNKHVLEGETVVPMIE